MFPRSSKWLNAASGRTRSRMIFRQSPGPCKAASVGGLAYRHIGYFIPLFIGHRRAQSPHRPFFCKLTGNLSGMSPRGFEVRVVLPLLLLLKRAVVFDVKEIAPFDCPLGFRTCFLPLVSIVAHTKAGKLRKVILRSPRAKPLKEL